MKVFDFDNTIYNGESIVDFFAFLLKKNKSLAFYIPKLIKTIAKYKHQKLSIDELYQIADKLSPLIIKNKENAEQLIKEFWLKNGYKLKDEMLDKIDENDVIITASPQVLIDGIKDKLRTKNIICSKINLDTGKLEYLCMHSNKVSAFKELYGDIEIDEFYTDSLNDIPMMNLSKRTFLVNGSNIKELSKNEIIEKDRRQKK